MERVVGGQNVHYIDRGTGAPVLLLHGWGASAQTYHLIIDHLAAYRRVIAPDLPGFGGSEKPPFAWSVDDYATFVAAFIAACGLDDLAVIGHSNGGRILIRLLARPDNAFRVTKAVLIDSAGVKPRRKPSYYIKVGAFKTVKAFFRLPGVRRLFPSAVEKARRRFGSADYKDADPLMRAVMVKAVNEDVRALMPQIRVPTLLIWGDKDTATPLRDGQIMERLIPDAGLVILRGGGHFSFADGWEQCRRVLDSFLK